MMRLNYGPENYQEQIPQSSKNICMNFNDKVNTSRNVLQYDLSTLLNVWSSTNRSGDGFSSLNNENGHHVVYTVMITSTCVL